MSSKISELNPLSSGSGTDIFPVVRTSGSGSNNSISGSILKDYFSAYEALSISPTTSDTTLVENIDYFIDLSGLTANRNLKLPTPSGVGKRIGIHVVVGDDTYAGIVIGDSSVTINSGSVATEWSRLFISGETLTLVSTSTSNWQVINDGRIPCFGNAERSSIQTITTNTTTQIAIDSIIEDNSNIVDITTNDRVDIRRSGKYSIIGYIGGIQLNDGDRLQVFIRVNDVSVRKDSTFISATSYLNGFIMLEHDISVGDYIDLAIWHNYGSDRDTNTDIDVTPTLTVRELLIE